MSSKNRHNMTISAAVLALILAFTALLLIRSGLFAKDPVVRIKAENCYADTLHVITDEDYRPYSFYDKDGKSSGHDVELIALLANRMHMNLDLKFLPWNEGIAATLADKAQVLMTCDFSDTFAGTEQLIKSEPMSVDEFTVYSKKKISSVNELYNKRIGVMSNGNVLSQIEMLRLTTNCTEYPDNRLAMQALLDGKVDCTIIRNAVGTTLLAELDANEVKAYLTIGQSYMCFGINSAHPDLAEKINWALEDVKRNGDLQKLSEKWLTTFVQPYTLGEIIENNIGLIIGFLAILATLMVLLLFNIRRNQKAEEEKNRYILITENLSNDFECVNYVPLQASKRNDKAQIVRTSSLLSRNIPGWDKELNFNKRLDMMCQSIVAPEDRQAFIAATRRDKVLAKIKGDNAYFVNFKAILDGEPRFFQMKFSSVNEMDGAPTGLVFGVHNIDAQTKAEISAREQLKEAKDQLEAANKSKTDFLFNMSHDIRTPMNAIIGFTDLAGKHIDDKERVEDCLAKIKTSGDHLLNLINEVLDMSRVEAGKLKSDLKYTSVRESCEKLIAICLETARSRNISLSFKDNGIRNNFVFADELHINQVLMNILGNALKYTMPGGEVTLSASELPSVNPEYGHYQFVVEDTGIGMSSEFLKKIFDTFSREETQTVSGIQGTGLGMSIVKRLVDYMDGQIDIESEQGQGTKVTISLFMRIAGDSLEADEPDTNADASLSGKKILLVEDNELNREIATFVLQEQGLTVEEATNGVEAVERIKEKGADYYDCVLMDIQMPLMNGYQATDRIRALPGADKLIIIALSANAFEEDRKASLDAGMNDHLPKPINPDQLTKTLSKYLK